MQEFLIMVGLSILLAFAAFAELPDPYVQSGRSFPTSSDSRLSSVPRNFSAESQTSQRPVVPVVPNQGTAEFVDTSTQFSAVPEREPKGMPERRLKPSGFR